MKYITFVVPSYNAEKYLDQCLESVLNQTYKDFEWIIVDDGCNEIELDYLPARVIHLANKSGNASLPRNVGLDNAKGQYIARMDADDYCDKERLEKQLEYLTSHPECGILATNAILFDSDGCWGYRKFPKIIKKKDFLGGSPVIHPSIMLLKEKYISNGKYLDVKRTLRCEDYDFFMRAFANKTTIHTLQENLYYFREDKDAVNRRKFRYRISEMKTRFYGFKINKIAKILFEEVKEIDEAKMKEWISS